jgi:hypothetical protein
MCDRCLKTAMYARTSLGAVLMSGAQFKPAEKVRDLSNLMIKHGNARFEVCRTCHCYQCVV